MFRLSVVVVGVGLWSSPAVADLLITETVPGAFIDISATGTALGLGDDGVAEIAPGFDLTQTLFAGDGSGRIWVANNGAIGFLGDDGSVGAFYLNTELPNFGLFGGAHGTPQALAPYWDDLDSDTGDVYYQTIGEPCSRVLIIQWQDRPHYPGNGDLDGDEATFQVQIFEDGCPGHAQFLYQDVDFLDPLLNNGASATIGYQAGGIGNDVQWSFNTPDSVHAGDVLTLVGVTGRLGDLDGDGFVGIGDLLILLAAWGPCPNCAECTADLNHDCIVGISDLLTLLANWG
ncbi:MAG: hypothetical protein ACYS0G_09425 [Planctomycetota bacterium]|jgi:hypothetical protein